MAAELFQPFQHIPGAAERSFRIQFRQPGRQVAVDRLPRIIQQSRVVQPHSFGQGAAQAGYPAGVQPGQGGQQPGQLRLGRRLAQGVQAVLNLHILDFAEVAVNFQHKLAEVVRRGVDAQVPVQFGLLHHFPNLAFQQRQLGRIQGLALVMFIQQLLEFGDVAIAVGGGHRRDEVVNNRGVGAALGLSAFARIVDDKGIKERQIVQGRLRIAGGGEADALARQPFQSAVLADMHHSVGPENLPNPAVIGQVMVGRGQVRAVIDGDGIFAKAAGRLQADENVAQFQAGNRQGIPGAIDLARRIPPSRLQLLLYGRVKIGKPLGILAAGYLAGGQFQLLRGQGIPVVAAPGNDAVYQFIPISRDVIHPVAGILQSVEQRDYRGRGIQADGVADAGVFSGVVAHNNGNALVGVGFAAQVGPFDGQAGQGVHAVRSGHIALQAGKGQGIVAAGVAVALRGRRRFLLKGNGNGDNAAVELGQGYIHRGVDGAEAQGIVGPFLAGAGADDALQDWHIQSVQQIYRPAGGDGRPVLLAQIAHGQAHSVDDAVHPGDAGGVGHKVGQGAAALPVLLRVMLEAVGIDRQHIDLVGFEAADQGIDELEIAAHPVGAVKEQAHAGAAGLETLADIGIRIDDFCGGGLRMVKALPRQGFRGFVAVVAAQVGIAEKEQEVAEVGYPAAHQVGEHRFQFRDRRGAGGYQILVPFLMAGAGNQRDAAFPAEGYQRVKSLGHSPLAAEEPQHYHAGAAHGIQQLVAGLDSIQSHRVPGVHRGKIPGQSGQGPVGGKQVGVGGSYQYHRFLPDLRRSGQNGSCLLVNGPRRRGGERP